MSAREPLVLLSGEEAQVVFSVILTYPWSMRGARSALSCTGPNKLAVVVVDIRARIEISIGSEEYVTWREEVFVESMESDYGRVKVWSLSMIK